MNKSLAALAIAALVTVPTSAVKTEWMDNAFSFFDKPLWNSFGGSSQSNDSHSHSGHYAPSAPAAPSGPSGNWNKFSNSMGSGHHGGSYFDRHQSTATSGGSSHDTSGYHGQVKDNNTTNGFAKTPGTSKIPDTSTLNPNHRSPFTRSGRGGTNTPNPYNQGYTPFSNSFVNDAVPGNTRAIEKAFDCCLEHRDLIAALRERLAALKAKAEANKGEIDGIGGRIDAAETGTDDLEKKVANNETGISSLDGRVKANDDMIAALTGRVD